MTKDVLISVKGLQLLGDDDSAEPIEVVTVGEYRFEDGYHYLRFNEIQEGFDEVTENYIKADARSLEVRKSGLINMHMIFEEEKKNFTYYKTPFGVLYMGISATRVDFSESENNIDIHVDYALEMNYEHVADCFLQLNVKPKASPDFKLN